MLSCPEKGVWTWEDLWGERGVYCSHLNFPLLPFLSSSTYLRALGVILGLGTELENIFPPGITSKALWVEMRELLCMSISRCQKEEGTGQGLSD